MNNLNHQRNLFKQMIIEHSQKPWHRGKTNLVHRQERGHNPYCGDTVELTIQLNETEEIIEEIKFEGNGCALCLASADLMADAVKSKSIEEALLITQQFRQMMRGQTQFSSQLRKLNSLQGVSQYPMRIKCVTLPWHTLKAALRNGCD